MSALSLGLTERQFTDKVIDRAKARGWMVYHPRPARTKGGGWTVALQGHRGWPDLCIAQDGVVLFIELKATSAKGPTPEQEQWLKHTNGVCFRPRDWPKICELLDLPARAKASAQQRGRNE